MNIKDTDWISITDSLPEVGRQVLVCDTNNIERKMIQVVTYSGINNREWQNQFDGMKTVGLHQFTHWVLLQAQLPKEDPQAPLMEFLQDLALKKRGDSITVTFGPYLTENVVMEHINRKIGQENWGLMTNSSKRPTITYTFDFEL